MTQMRCLVVVWMMLLSGCSLLFDLSGQQCDTSAQCISAKLGNRCVNHVCVETDETPGDGTCSDDVHCAGGTPRCMNGTCVSEELADRWLCPAEIPVPRSGTVRYSLRAVDFVSRMPAKNVTAAACLSTDAGCEAPVARFTDSNGSAMIELDLPHGFLGFIEVKSDALPAISYLTKPVTKDTTDRDLPVLQPSTLFFVSALIDHEFDPTKGLALVDAFDCSGVPAGGVQISESRGTSTRFYVVDSAPSLDATVTEYDAVNNVADAGFLNIQPGFVTFEARWGVDGPQLGKFNALIRANTITFVDMHF